MAIVEKAEVGRPLIFKNVNEMQTKIEQYFKSCEGELFKNADGDIVLDKYGNPVIIGAKPPTVTGLALALGFNSRQSLLNYQGKKEFLDTITRAKSTVEEYAEQRLFDRDGVQGAKFSLTNNFKGWREKLLEETSESNSEQEQEHDNLISAIKKAVDDED